MDTPKNVLRGSSSRILPVGSSKMRISKLTVSMTKLLPTDALVSGGRQSQFESKKSIPS